MTPRRPLQNRYIHRAITLVFLLTVTLTMSAQWPAQQDEGGIPAYNAGPPSAGTKLPPLLTKADLWDADAKYPYQTHAYELASKIPTVLHQQNKKGKTAAQIRAGIIKGEWKSIDLQSAATIN